MVPRRTVCGTGYPFCSRSTFSLHFGQKYAKEEFKPVSFVDQCAQVARKNAGTPVYMGICGITPIFLWFFPYFGDLVQVSMHHWAVANRSITHWTCTKLQKDDKMTKTRISPVFLPKKCPYFARYFYKNEPVWRIGHTGWLFHVLKLYVLFRADPVFEYLLSISFLLITT